MRKLRLSNAKVIWSIAMVCAVSFWLLYGKDVMLVNGAIRKAEQLIQQGDEAGAQVELKIAMQYDPFNIRAGIQLARILRYQEDRAGLQDLLRGMWQGGQLEQLSAFADINFLAHQYYYCEAYDKAEKLFRRSLQLRDSYEIRTRLAEVLVWQRNFIEAEQYLRALNFENPDDKYIEEFWADTLMEVQQYAQAANIYSRMLKTHSSSNQQTFLKLGISLKMGGGNAHASKIYEQYVARDEHSDDTE